MITYLDSERLNLTSALLQPATKRLRSTGEWLRQTPAHKILSALRFLIPLLVLVLSPRIFATTYTLNPVADTDTQSDVAAGTNSNLNFSQYCTGLMKFDLSSVSGTASGATLRFYTPYSMAATTVTVSSTSNETWVEGGTKPGVGTTITTKAQSAISAAYIEVDLTSYVQSKLSGSKIVSIAISNTLSGWTGWNSREASTNKPQLVVTAATSGGTTNLNPVADTDNQSDVAAGTNTSVNVSAYCNPYFKFDVSSISGTVTSGVLRLYFNYGTSATTYTVDATSNDTWVEGGTKPTLGSFIMSKGVGALSPGYIEFDITSFVQSKLTGDKVVSVGLVSTLSGWTGILSRESSTNKPTLVITTSGGTSVPVTGISLTPTSATVGIGATTSLSATVSPSNATNPAVSWHSANTAIAAVNSAGTVTGVGAGSVNITATSTDGSNITSNVSTIIVSGSGGGGTVTRPSYNTGHGLFVLGNKLYDANGVPFIIRGLNKLHWDAPNSTIPNSNANAVRWVVDLSQPTSTNLGLMQTSINAHEVPIPGYWTNASCPDESYLPGIVNTWISQSSAWLTLNNYMILNVANELGASNNTSWRDAYITAVGQLRAAGYTCPLMIDSGWCGQDLNDLINYASAILASDPQKNIVFSIHIYGIWSADGSSTFDLSTGMTQLANSGLCVVVGEFGPGRNIGPSPTMMTPQQIITTANSHGIGWMAWAWDDPAYTAPDNSFALTINASYTSTSDLTTYGKDVIENSSYGLKATAVKQTAF
jgi:uncharacterized protein YjdB